ncbi:ribonuclease Y [Longivirga aurantiaca]|uniref:Ribonuclease Y n=1 Tax=Longivirga aurantiaca TaxID=1837743 RepID=A0ABW1T133_9ACTN
MDLARGVGPGDTPALGSPLVITLLVAVLALVGVLVWLVLRSRRHDAEALRDRDAAVAAAVDAELGRRQRDLDDRAEKVRADAAAEAGRTRALAEQALASAEQARAEAADDVRRAEERRTQAESDVAAARAELTALREEAQRREERLAERESRLDAELADLVARLDAVTAAEAALVARQAVVAEAESRLAAERAVALERVAEMTAADAKTELVATIEAQAKREAALTVREIEREAKEEGEDRARRIVTLAAQRIATEQTAESTVSVLHLPDDSMKGRIIGREGRNIRTFEAVTGVNLLIDDTPEAVLLSSFDPVRREVARVTLEALVADGRIQPSRIEDEYERARLEVDARCIRAAEDALVDLSIGDMHPDLIALLGRLRFRTSYGQNVLGHLVEAAHLAGIMAAELGLPVEHSKRCALLHDIGKALTHEVEGSHALIGAEVARRYGEHEDVVHAIEAHHNEVEVRTLEAVLTQTADGMSGGRPGARRESLEHYVERLERLESIASGYAGVEKVFAMQAGREVRVVVVPEQVDDISMQVLARDIAAEIEHELTYPGQIRVTVVRESRATGLAR